MVDTPLINNDDIVNYKMDTKYMRVGNTNEFVPYDDLVHKKDLLWLMNIFETYIISMGNKGIVNNEELRKEIRSLRRSLDKK